MTRYWVGGYAADGPGGVALLDEDDPAPPVVAGVTPDPSFLLQPSRSGLLHAVDEGGDAVVTLRRTAPRTLEVVARSRTAGSAPCHLSVAAGGTVLLAACYADGIVSAHRLDGDGLPGPAVALPAHPPAPAGPHPAQDGPHAHATLELGDLLLVADLGTDRVLRHRGPGFAPDGVIALPAGAGPRDLLAHPSGRILVLGEHDCRVHVVDAEARRLLASVPATSDPVADDQAAAMTLDGPWLTVGLRGSDRIAVLLVGDDGIPRPVTSAPTGGRWPRHHVRAADALLVANERSGTITRLPWHPGSDPGPAETVAATPSPTFLLPCGTGGGPPESPVRFRGAPGAPDTPDEERRRP